MLAARMSRGLSLKDVAGVTRIDSRMLDHIEHGRFALLPPGIYARAWVRAYASAVGLDPTDVLADIDPLLPRVDERIEAIVDVRQRTTESLPTRDRKYQAAAAADAAILFTIAGLFVVISAAACRVSVRALMDVAWLPFAVLFAILACAYFLILGGAGGRTPGGTIFGVPPDSVVGPLDLPAAGRRGARCFLAEASFLLGLR